MVKNLMKNKKKRLSKEQIVENKNRAGFKKQIKDIFTLSGFNSLNVQGFQFELGNRSNELDHCFIYENIIIICEDTIKSLKKKDLAATNGESFNRNHKLEKNESAHIIITNKERFIGILKQRFPDVEQIKIYNPNEFRIFYLYFEYGKQHISSEDENRYSYLKFIDYPTLNYLSIMSKSLKASFKYEIFRFLNLSRTDIGKPDPFGNNNKPIISSIIYPDSVTGFNNGIRMVSFMMRPSDLIENSFVLRKDGWEQNVDLYQRLITPKRIKSIRDFVVNNKTTFLNNIIVTLPPNVEFYKKENGKRSPINIDDITKYNNNVETLVVLSKKSASHIVVDVEFGEGEGQISLKEAKKSAEEQKPKKKITYKDIQRYVEENYGFKVHTAYIAEVKRELGLPMYDAPNAVEELKRPRSHPTEEMTAAIKASLKHFEII